MTNHHLNFKLASIRSTDCTKQIFLKISCFIFRVWLAHRMAYDMQQGNSCRLGGRPLCHNAEVTRHHVAMENYQHTTEESFTVLRTNTHIMWRMLFVLSWLRSGICSRLVCTMRLSANKRRYSSHFDTDLSFHRTCFRLQVHNDITKACNHKLLTKYFCPEHRTFFLEKKNNT